VRSLLLLSGAGGRASGDASSHGKPAPCWSRTRERPVGSFRLLAATPVVTLLWVTLPSRVDTAFSTSPSMKLLTPPLSQMAPR